MLCRLALSCKRIATNTQSVSQTVEVSRTSEGCVRLNKYIESVESAGEHSIVYGCKDHDCYTRPRSQKNYLT